MLKEIKTLLVAVFCLSVISVVSAPAASANDDWDKKTTITVNQPFEVGRKILPAGTYVLKIVDLLSDRTVVRFFGSDETTIYATVIGIPDFRLRPSEKAEITFYESEPARPRALHAWFYPGYQYGIEFVYPKARAVEIAKVAEEHVMAVREPEPVLTFPEPPPEPTVEELLAEPVIAIEPGGEEAELAEVHPEAVVVPPEVEPPAPAPVLPKTATPFSLIALIGLLAAGAASTVRALRK
jgi:hypothetical protein